MMRCLFFSLYAIGFAGGLKAQAPVITSFSPASAIPGASVTLTGTGFNVTTTNNIVYFGATRATVTAASASSITATVPTGATNAPINLLNTGTVLACASLGNFNPIYSPAKATIGTGDLDAKQDFTTLTGPISVAIGDLDGDGKADLAVADSGSARVSVLRNTASSGSIASGSFATKVDITTGTGPVSVAIGDLDGDGKPDLAVTNRGSTTVSIFRNTSSSGTVSFAAKADFTTGTNPYSVAIGDLDGDGKPDLAVANNGSNTVSVLRNTSVSGTVGFATKVDFTTGTAPRAVAIGDLDGDGKSDLAVTNYSSASVSVFRNTSSSGTVSFAAKVDFTTGTSPRALAIGDLDGDGKSDLAVANYGSASVSVFRSTSSNGSIASGSFATKVDITTGTNPYSVAIGDLDGDGKPDLAASNYNSTTVSVFRNASTSGSIASGSFATKVDFTTGPNPCGVAIGDLDGDGKPDLAVTNFGATTVSVLRNADCINPTSGGTIAGSQSGGSQFNPAAFTSSAAASGHSGTLEYKWQSSTTSSSSGFSDIASSNSATYDMGAIAQTTWYKRLARVLPCLDDWTGAAESNVLEVTVYPLPVITSFSPASAIPGASVTLTGTGFNTTTTNNIVYFGATRATVTAASATSITVTVPTGATYAPITLLNTGTVFACASLSNFNPIYSPAKANIGLGDFPTRVDLTTGTGPASVAIGDLDGDGKSDLAVANGGSASVSVLRNTASSGSIVSGSFATKVDFTTGTNPYFVAIGDLDGDGKPDLAVTNNGSASVSVFRNTSSSGTVSFATKVDFTTGTNPYSVAIGDLDGDGKPELAVVNNSSTGGNTVSVFRNTSSIGTVSFATKVDFTTGTLPRAAAIGDLDGDGKPELAVTNYNSNSVSVFRNTSISGTVSFATKVDFTTGTRPYSVAIGDLDGDGKPDLAVTIYATDTVSVFRNTASSGSITTSSFATRVNFKTGSDPYLVVIGDLDGDGKPELAVLNTLNGTGGNTVSVFRNTASSGSITTSSFAAKVDFTTGTNPRGVAIGDLDGDGKPDLAVANALIGTGGTVSVLRNSDCINPTSGGTIAGSQSGNNSIDPAAFTSSAAASGHSGMLEYKWQSSTTSSSSGFSDIASSNSATYDAGTITQTTWYKRLARVLPCLDDWPVAAESNVLEVTVYLPPDITSFSPASAIPGASVTLTGTGFNTTTTNNIVYFGATRATVTAASATSITVTVPTGATFAPITLLNTGTVLACASLSNFNPIYSPAKATIGTGDLAAKQDFTTLTEPISVAIGDLDGDGKPDLAVVNGGHDRVSVLRNTASSGSIASGSFATKVDISTGTGPESVAICDLDGDGKLDLAVANRGSRSVSILRNTSSIGTVSFAAKVDFTATALATRIAIGDLDGDGLPDLAVTRRDDSRVSVFRNTSSIGTVSFVFGSAFFTGSSPRGVAIGDLDGDGKPDLAVANSGSASVSVFRNTSSSGTVSFASKVDFTTGTSPFSIAIGDLDGDGKSDLAVANSGSASVSVLRNTASSGSITSGSFDTKVDFTTGTNPYSVAIGDLDGDGKPDLAAANYSSTTVSVFRNTATSGSIASGSFATMVDFTTGTNPYSVAIGDLDGDGKADLVVTNFGTTTVSVLRNSDCSNPTSGGTIASAQSGFNTIDPDAFTSSAAASGNNVGSTLEYKWQSSTTSSSSGFSDIASSNSTNYDAGTITQTTWYKRLARVSCLANWTGAAESNVLEVTVVSSATWNGSVSTNWNTAANWTPNAVPAVGQLVDIPSGLTNYPAVPNDRTISSLSLASEASLNLNSNTLTITSNLSNAGGITGAGKLTLAGSSAQSISGSGTISNLEVNNSAGVTITSGAGNMQSITGAIIPTAGTLTTNGNLTLKSSTAGTARVAPLGAGAAISGNVTLERYIPAGRKWRFLTVPLTGSSNNSVFYNWQNNDVPNGATGVEIWGPGGHADPSSSNTGLAVGPNPSMRSYGSSGWQGVTNTNRTLLFDSTTNYGYALFQTGPYNNGSTSYIGGPGSLPAAAATTISATGNLITGDHTKNFTATSAGQYFLVGNPYASPVDPRSFTTSGTDNRRNLYGKLWMWDAKPGGALGRYVSFDLSSNAYNINGHGYQNDNVMIQSGQAFFVQATDIGPARLVFRETSKNPNGSHAMMGDEIRTGKSLLRLTLQQPLTGDSTENLDGAVAVFHAEGKPGLDPLDGSKLMNSSENIFFRREERSLTFEHRPMVTATDTLQLRMSNLQARSYRLQAEGADFTDTDGVSAELIDRFTGRSVPLSLTGKTDHPFTVTADSLSTGDRFLVVFRRAAAPVVVTPDRDGNSAGLKLYPNPVRDDLQVSVNVSMTGPYTVQVVSGSGEPVWMRTGIVSGTKRVEINTSGMVSGVYHLVLTDAQGGRTVRKFVKE